MAAHPELHQMVAGNRREYPGRIDIGVSITGVAGPEGGTAEKPVGLVYIGLASPDGDTRVLELMAHGDRQRIRSQSANAALDLLRKALRS